MTNSTTDFIAKQTAKDLAAFACMFEVEPYVVYRGWFYEPLFYGASELPAYRKSKSLEDIGYITTAWDNGRMFQNRADRNRACVLDASKHASRDRSRGKVLRIANNPSTTASRAYFRDILTEPTVEEKHTGTE